MIKSIYVQDRGLIEVGTPRDGENIFEQIVQINEFTYSGYRGGKVVCQWNAAYVIEVRLFEEEN